MNSWLATRYELWIPDARMQLSVSRFRGGWAWWVYRSTTNPSGWETLEQGREVSLEAAQAAAEQAAANPRWHP